MVSTRASLYAGVAAGLGALSGSLHGGAKGFDKHVWQAEPVKGKDSVGVKLSYLSKDGEMGFPGNLKTEAIGCSRRRRVSPLPLQNIRPVDASRFHLDEHLMLPDSGDLTFADL